MTRPKIVAFVIAVAIAGACELARAQAQANLVLEVDSDAPEVISRESIAERVAADLSGTSGRVTITVRYRDADRSLVVRATREDGRTVERTVKAEGDAAAVQREAVLLASNVARDEARELLDALASRPKPAEPPAAVEPPPEPPPKTAPPPPREEDLRIVNGGIAYPIATNFGHPSVTTYFDLSLLFGRVGKVKGMQLGSGVAWADAIRGVQLAPVTVADDVEGTQLGVINIARRVKGAQIGVLNIAEEVEGGAAGLISIHRDSFHPAVWGGNLAHFNIAIMFESTWLYTLFGVSYGSLETGLRPYLGSVGAIGTRLRIVADLDAGLETAFSNFEPDSAKPDASNTWFHQRAVLGYRFAKRLRVFAGGGFRAPVSIDEGSHAFRPDFTGGLEF